MKSLIDSLAEEHGVIGSALDRLAESVTAGRLDGDMFHDLVGMITRHYLREELFLCRLQFHEPDLAAKMRLQHEEALEIAGYLERSLTPGEIADVRYLTRRFLAIAQHNIIEEERDVFPLAKGFFSAEEDEP